mgnify:CR=1 FL=1
MTRCCSKTKLRLVSQPGGAEGLLQAHLPERTIGLAWLGQAGFVFKHADFCCLIDPYLSDALARKSAGTDFPHIRLMPPPVAAQAIGNVHLVLCSHRHGDHMDPDSLPIIAANNPSCRFIVPKAEMDSALAIGLEASRLIPVNADDALSLSNSLSLHVIPAAHEVVRTNAAGEHHYLGFVLRTGRLAFYHAGDSVVYDGLADRLRSEKVDVALLPVNGRRPELSSRGILGNMTFDEAVGLCAATSIQLMVPHHFGMFAFNTVDRKALESRAASPDLPIRCIVPTTNVYYLLDGS